MANRKFRMSSMPPPRSFSISRASIARESSMRPDFRSSSIAPSANRRFRSTSIAPAVTYSSRSRASSLMPQSSIGRSRAVSVLPLSTTVRRDYRASSCVPTFSRQKTNFYSMDPVSSISTIVPTRQFGSKLGLVSEISSRPAIYDEYYGTTYVPSAGRDSWSAYRISDETLDDNDDLVYNSAKRDVEVMKKVNRQIAEAVTAKAQALAPAPQPQRSFTPARVYRSYTPQPASELIQLYPAAIPTTQRVGIYKRPDYVSSTAGYKSSYPRVRVSFDDSSLPKTKVASKPLISEDNSYSSSQPSSFSNLKSRLLNARNSMASRPRRSEDDPELARIMAEVEAIKSSRANRGRSMDYSRIAVERPNAQLRRRLKDVLRRSKYSHDF